MNNYILTIILLLTGYNTAMSKTHCKSTKVASTQNSEMPWSFSLYKQKFPTICSNDGKQQAQAYSTLEIDMTINYDVAPNPEIPLEQWFDNGIRTKFLTLNFTFIDVNENILFSIKNEIKANTGKNSQQFLSLNIDLSEHNKDIHLIDVVVIKGIENIKPLSKSSIYRECIIPGQTKEEIEQIQVEFCVQINSTKSPNNIFINDRDPFTYCSCSIEDNNSANNQDCKEYISCTRGDRRNNIQRKADNDARSALENCINWGHCDDLCTLFPAICNGN